MVRLCPSGYPLKYRRRVGLDYGQKAHWTEPRRNKLALTSVKARLRTSTITSLHPTSRPIYRSPLTLKTHNILLGIASRPCDRRPTFIQRKRPPQTSLLPVSPPPQTPLHLPRCRRVVSPDGTRLPDNPRSMTDRRMWSLRRPRLDRENAGASPSETRAGSARRRTAARTLRVDARTPPSGRR